MPKRTPIPWYENVVVAESLDAFWKCFTASTPSHNDPTTTYERHYGPFENKIREVLTKHGVPKRAADYFDDWSRNRTRHVRVECRFVTAAVVADLHKLLRRKYEQWRIEVVLVGSLAADDVLGAIEIRSDWASCFALGRGLLYELKRTNS